MIHRLMIVVAAAGYRRWLAHPWQWTLGHLTIIVGASAVGLALWRASAPTIVLVSSLAIVALGTLLLARSGFTLVDIATVLAIVLFTASLMFPAMQRTRALTLGRRTLPVTVPGGVGFLLRWPG
jgi:hypothetical protein